MEENNANGERRDAREREKEASKKRSFFCVCARARVFISKEYNEETCRSVSQDAELENLLNSQMILLSSQCKRRRCNLKCCSRMLCLGKHNFTVPPGQEPEKVSPQ